MRIKTNIAGLDKLLNDGLIENTVNIVSGPAGSGKTLLALQFLYNGARDFEAPGILITIEEGSNNVKMIMKNHSMDIDKFIETGKIYLIDLGEPRKGPQGTRRRSGFDAVMEILDSLIKLSKAKRLVIDSLGGIGVHYKNAEEFRQGLFQFTRFLKENEITTILTTESINDKSLSRYGVEEFIADTFIYLGLKEVEGELVRTINIRKMRCSWHDSTLHSFQITDTGIEIS